jgi:hypothetical protein
MATQTAERKELYRIIDEMPDDGVVVALDFVRNMCDETPSAKTIAAIEEAESGDLRSFDSIESLMSDLNSDDTDD